MKKSREFDNVLDECLERLLVKGATIAQCLQSFPEHADELKPLLETALVTRKASAIQPRPEFRDKARYQLASAIEEMEPKRSRSFLSWGWQPQWVTVIAVVLVLLLAGGGTVAAAGGSMPDESLYPVKLASERVQLVFTPSVLGKAEFYAELADRRVAEIAYLAGKNKPDHIERTARRLDTYLTEIATLSSPEEMASNATVAPPVEEAPLLPERTMGAPEQMAGAAGVEEAGIKVDRRARLKRAVGRQAIDHPARLRALLKTVPQSARPALLRAIDVSENGYEKAFKSLDRP